MKSKLAIFDMDGTLFDTKTAIYISYKRSAELNSKNFSVSEDFFNKNCFGKSYKKFLRQYTDWDEKIIEAVHDTKIEIYPAILKESSRINISLFDILRGLKSRYFIALVTSASKAGTFDMLDYYSCRNDFDLIITGEDVTYPKPDPEGFLKAIEHFSVDASQTLIFEDSDECIDAAKSIGVNVYKVENF